jgi:glutaredoxin-related protein
MPTKSISDMTVQRTISLPLSVLEQVKGEADLMGCGFSEATVKLLRISLRMREQHRIDEEREQKETLRKMQEASRTV